MTKDQTGSITVRLGTMREPFARVCDARGMSVSNGIRQLVAEIVALIRANLQREPEFGETGLDALYESNRILSPLARNLNQLARDIHQNGSRISAYRFQILENLQKIIPAHINVIARVISRNVGRWRTE